MRPRSLRNPEKTGNSDEPLYERLASMFYEFGVLYLMYEDIIGSVTSLGMFWKPWNREDSLNSAFVTHKLTLIQLEACSEGQNSTKTISDSIFFSLCFLTLVLLWPLKFIQRHFN